MGGIAKASLALDEEAVEWLRRSIETNPNYPATHFYLASALANLGRHEEARAAVEVGHALDPSFSVQRYRFSPLSDSPIYLARRERIVAGMRKAGVPEE
jgi:tetratricopeptide (TPR) repeat protein